MDWTKLCYDLLVSFSAGVAGSFVFLHIVLARYKPKLGISTNIVCKKDFDSNAMCYTFKFVNRSSYPAYEIKVELFKVKRIPAGSGNMHERKTPIELVQNYISSIPGKPKKKDKDILALHAVTVRTKVDVATILADDTQSVVLKVMLRHGLSSLVTVFTWDFGPSTPIKNGGFEHGDSLGAF